MEDCIENTGQAQAPFNNCSRMRSRCEPMYLYEILWSGALPAADVPESSGNGYSFDRSANRVSIDKALLRSKTPVAEICGSTTSRWVRPEFVDFLEHS